MNYDSANYYGHHQAAAPYQHSPATYTQSQYEYQGPSPYAQGHMQQMAPTQDDSSYTFVVILLTLLIILAASAAGLYFYDPKTFSSIFSIFDWFKADQTTTKATSFAPTTTLAAKSSFEGTAYIPTGLAFFGYALLFVGSIFKNSFLGPLLFVLSTLLVLGGLIWSGVQMMNGGTATPFFINLVVMFLFFIVNPGLLGRVLGKTPPYKTDFLNIFERMYVSMVGPSSTLLNKLYTEEELRKLNLKTYDELADEFSKEIQQELAKRNVNQTEESIKDFVSSIKVSPSMVLSFRKSQPYKEVLLDAAGDHMPP